MAQQITDQTIEEVEILAQLDLTGQQKEQAKSDMQKMLNYIDKLDELDTGNVPPMTHASALCNVFREDEVIAAGFAADLPSNAPQWEDGQFKVPRTVK